MDQFHYQTQLVRKFGFQDFVPLPIPTNAHTHLNFFSSNDCNPNPSFPYHSIVGSLQFACIKIRLVLSYAISVATKFCANHSLAHRNVLQRILKYLVRILSFGIFFFGNDHSRSLTAYIDADFAIVR